MIHTDADERVQLNVYIFADTQVLRRALKGALMLNDVNIVSVDTMDDFEDTIAEIPDEPDMTVIMESSNDSETYRRLYYLRSKSKHPVIVLSNQDYISEKIYSVCGNHDYHHFIFLAPFPLSEIVDTIKISRQVMDNNDIINRRFNVEIILDKAMHELMSISRKSCSDNRIIQYSNQLDTVLYCLRSISSQDESLYRFNDWWTDNSNEIQQHVPQLYAMINNEMRNIPDSRIEEFPNY
ncbi:hypothetical protein ACFL41_00075 [Gemmatimonadota bacterium]